ncbi:ATP-binding protein [Aquabacterium sp.]|uniref:ATP-binding protein n=1 Tax=Aquabacterium sp. TaxID=1872578 RepID=UPI00403846F3
MASPPPAQWAAGWVKYRRFSELILVSAAGHFVFALAYGLYMGQWAIAAVLGLPATLVLALYPLFKSRLAPARIRWCSHLMLLGNLAGLVVALMWMGLSASTAVWWLVWWPMFVAHVMGVVDGLIWLVIAMVAAVLLWQNQQVHWVAPLMRHEDNPMFLMQACFLLIGGGVSVVVRRAYDRFGEEIDAHQRMIDSQNLSLERRAVRLEAMLQAVQQSSLDRTRLFAQISHEVRTPLNGILGFTTLLKRTELNAQQGTYTEQIDRCGNTLLQIINDVLDFSRLESQPAQLDQQRFDAVQLAHEAVDMVSSIAEQKGVALVRDFPEGEIQAVGDPLRVKQVLLNLLANAVKFTAQGEVAVRCCAMLRDDGQQALHVEVQDSGIGIPDEALGQLFQPFNKASDSTIRQYGGSGLGLAICKRLVDMMNGRIGVDSQPGSGSLFWFEVPISAN